MSALILDKQEILHSAISTSVIYLGSLHSLNMEKYFSSMGYKNDIKIENKNLDSCIRTN